MTNDLLPRVTLTLLRLRIWAGLTVTSTLTITERGLRSSGVDAKSGSILQDQFLA